MSGKIPDVNHPFTEVSPSSVMTLTKPARLFMSNLQGIIDSSASFIYRYRRFDDLNDIVNTIKMPRADMRVQVTGQGTACYKSSVGQWVLASDDTTLIT